MMNGFARIKEMMKGTAVRRTIASVLAAAECFSVVAVGVPSSYALETDSYDIVEQLEPNGQSDQAELTAADSYALEQTQIQDEPQTVTPADAARLGAEAAAKYADEAGLAADEAENAAFETETILDAQELYEDQMNAAGEASKRAADASRRAADYAYRAADEARWAAEAVEVAARSADWADAEYARIAADSDMAAEAADRAAEEAALTAEEAALTAEKAAAAQAAARDAENIERLFSEILVIKDGTKDAAEITEEAESRIPIVIKDMTMSLNEAEEQTQTEELPQTEEQTKLAAEAAAQEADQATQEAAIASENAAIANENAARAAEETINKAEAARQAEENARFLAEEYDHAYASATEAVAQAERAYAEANRAQAAADRAAAAVAEAEAKLPKSEIVADTEATEATETAETIETPETPETPETTETPETPETTETPETPETTETAVTESELVAEAVSVKGEIPVGVSVEATKVSEKYTDFDPKAYVLSVMKNALFMSGSPENRRSTKESYKVLAAYDISLLLNGAEYQPEAGRPLEVSITDPAINENLMLQVWHIHDDGLGEQITDFSVVGNSVVFKADGFSDYLVVQVTVTTNITAGDGNTYQISVTYDQDANFPESTQLAVRELEGKEREDYVNQSIEALHAAAEDLAFARAFDISLLDPDSGMEVQPASGVRVSVSLLNTNINSVEELKVLHFGDAVETVTYTLNGDAVEFETDGFSVYVIAGYTVDFHWGDYTYSIAGESEITLSDLLEKLGVEEITVADVADVSFSNADYIEIEQTDSDWLLRSLAAFSTEEALTLILANGQSVEIKVTDEQKTITAENYATVLNNVADGDELVLAEDLHIQEALTITAWSNQNGFTIDLGGHTLTVDGGLHFQSNGAVLTLQNGTLAGNVAADSGSPAVKLGSGLTVTGTVSTAGGAVTIDGGTVGSVSTSNNTSLTISDGAVTGTVSAAGGTVMIDGGTVGSVSTSDGASFTMTDGTITGAVTTESGGTQTISGGTINGAVSLQNSTSVTISGGTFNGSVSATGDKNNIEISGGTFATAPIVNGEEIAYTVTWKNDDGTVLETDTSVPADTMPSYDGETPTKDPAVEYYYVFKGWTPEITPVTGDAEYTAEYKKIYYEQMALTITAAGGEKEYDGTELSTDSYDVKGTLAEGDSIESVAVTGGQTDVGESDNVPGDAVIVNTDGEDVTGRYAITYVPGTLLVTPRAVTVTANDSSKTYGDAEPELTATVEGLVGEDTINYTLTRAEGEGVGSYAITASGRTEQGNYTVSYHGGSFSITARSLTITAASAEKVYDGYALLSDAYTAAVGLADGDTIQSITHDEQSILEDVGEVNNVLTNAVIVNALGTNVTANYIINYLPGTLTITKKSITITAESEEKVYDGKALTTEAYKSTSLADGDVFDSVTVTGSQTVVGESSSVASNAVIVRPTSTEIEYVNSNYDIHYAEGTLKVTQRELTITADDAEKVYDGEELKKNSYTVEGLVRGDSVESVTVTGSQTDAGTKENVPSSAKIVNAAQEDVSTCYNIKYVNGTLTVTKKPVKLTAASGVQVYNTEEKTISGYTVSANGRQLDKVKFKASVSASGSGTEVGSYPVTFDGVTLNETTDSTGNYLVTETEDGTLMIVSSAPIEKRLSGFNGNEAEYTISINPNGLELNDGSSLTLKDTFTDNQAIDYDSVETSINVPYDYSGYTGTFTIPDSTPVTITYKTRVSGAAGDEVTFGNTAQLGATRDGGFASWFSGTVSETRTITPTGTDIEGSGGIYSIRLFVYAQDHMEKGLGGAVFRLLDSNQRPITYRAGDQAGDIVTYTTGSDGYVTVALDDGIIALHKNTIYYLEMVTAPVVHDESGSIYYQKDNTLYSFLITDDPSYSAGSAAYTYFNGDVLKVRCYSEAAGINVTKRFSGNFTLTDEQKNQNEFILQKEDMATGEWVEVERHSYSEFSYGSMNFRAGREGGAPLEQAVLYRLIELPVQVEGAELTSNVTIVYQRDNETIQENTNEFELNPDHNTYSFSLLFDNAYVDHKLTVVKLNELTGALLPGAEFTVYKALDNTEVKMYPTIGEGVLEIRREDEGADYAFNTAYYVVETKPPVGYLMPKNPEKIYFYFSDEGSGVPEGIPNGVTAVDLTTSFDSVVVHNNTESVMVPVTVTWNVDGSREWPAGVESVISLYQSVNGGEPEQVTRDGSPLTTTLSSEKSFDNTTFVNLPARDELDNDITYSIKQEDLSGYYTSYKVSGTGWYVVSNESAVSVTVEKQWYDLDGNPIDNPSDKQAVAFDLYRTTEDHAAITTRDELEAVLRGEEPVRTGVTLSAENGWINTVSSLQKQDAAGNPYYYFALEREDSMPRNNQDSYAIVPADGGNLRTLTIKNRQTPITVIIRADDLSKEYGHDEPAFTFTTEVQDDAWTAGEPVRSEDGSYSVTVTKDSETKQVTFTCTRTAGEDVGSYAIKLSGDDSQEGFRVRLDDGTLTITPAQVTVKGTASKVYGDPDPSLLVEITGLKEGDTISYYAYRDIGEQKGSYRITATGLTKQGNYEITYVNGYFTIEPAPLTVTADNTSKFYGEDDPALTVTMTGLKNNDAPSVIKEYTISRDKQGTEEGESVGEYPITVTGAEAQGNYTVTFVNGTFTIKGRKVTVKAENKRKAYGAADPTWEAVVSGLPEGETIEYSFTRAEGEDVGEYVITPSGETAQGVYEVSYEPGLLTIERAPMAITPENIIKALTDPITPDPKLTAKFDGLATRDEGIEPVAAYDSETHTWTYTYTREGKTEPEFSFRINRTPGETAGSYVIAATAFGDLPKNYNITYKTGVFTILPTFDVVLTQQTRDLVDYAQNPEYTYTAKLDLSSIGITSYTAGEFVDNEVTFTLPADGNSSKTLPIPSGAKLTVTQETENRDYTTSITLDTQPVAGTSVEINPVNRKLSIVVAHERIALPVEARAAQRQTAAGKADEEGAVVVTPPAYLGIPRDGDKNPIPQSADDFIAELDSQGVYNLPENMYYVPEHASVYNDENPVAQNVQAIRYDEENKVWQYSLNGTDFTNFAYGDQLELFYMPKYICRVQADGQSYYTLNEALTHIRDEYSGTGTIEMLIDRYTMPSADALTIPEGCNITLTTAAELGTKAVILRKPINLGHMFSNSGTLTLGSIVIDGNKKRVTANDAMLLNNGTLFVGGAAALQNAAGINGGAVYANSGSATVEANASITGNSAANGGAIYFNGGSLSIAAENITGNSATNGGAVYSSDANATHTLTLTGTLDSNSATNGGAVYMAGGKLVLETNGTISGNGATSGGAVFVTGGSLDLNGGSISENQATNGGAFYLTGGALNLPGSTVSGSTVSGNTAAEAGGAIYSSNATLSITGGSLSGNSATNGGAILLASGKASVGGAAVQGNIASDFGGAVCQTGGTLTVTGTIDGANTAQNGSAVFVQNGSATFDGCNITGNTATAGGAVGIGSAEARLHFAGNAKVTGNTWNEGAGNLYLDQNSDLIINTAGLGENADIGVRVKEGLLSTRGDVACKFGTYTGESNLSKFKNDVNTGLTACANNYKIIWSKGISVTVLRQNTYGTTTFPPKGSPDNTLRSFTYNPKSQTNSIYDLVMEMYSAVYKSSITANDLYAYSFASTATSFEQFLSEINWNSEEQKWDFVERTGDKATGTPGLKIYYSNGAYISIVNNSDYDLTVDSMSVLGKNVPFYGYPTVKNNITLETLTPVAAEDLKLKSGENIKLLFPGAVNRDWTLTGTFTDPTTGDPVSNAPYKYTLDRTHGGTEQTGTADANGSFTHSGKTNNTAGGSYEILFGNPTYICKVTDGGVEYRFPTLNAAWNYIVDNDLTYDGTTPGGTIEMLIDYLQPVSDVLNIDNSGYCLKLTTAATSGVQYPYVGQTGVTRATISRDSDNDGAAVIAMPYKKTKACTESECDAFLIVDNLTFDGKALAKKGNGGAISTANNVVTITRCDFKGYQAVRGGAVFVAWGALTIGGDDPNERCTFSNCSTGDTSGDKIGGGGIWTSAQNLVVKNADFDTCACIVGNSQGGAIFHNIRQNQKDIYEKGDSNSYAQFPDGYSLSSTTWIEGCTFKNCYSVAGSGGTIECDSMVITIKDCSFDGSYSNKGSANGGAVNILHNDAFGAADIYPNASLTVRDTTFNNCQTNTGSSFGGAICDQNSVKTEIINCDFINCSANKGGAIVTNREAKVPTGISETLPSGITVSILGSRFENCTARAEGGAVHTTTTKLTISDTYQDDNGQNVTVDASFKNCSATTSGGGVYQGGNVTGSGVVVNNVHFENCKSDTGNAGALMVNARSLSIKGTARENADDPYTFKDCSAGNSGGAVFHSPSNPVKATLTDVSFYNCSAKAEGGGARLASTAIEISGAEVRNCEAVTNGGGLYVQGTTTMENCVFSGNKATGETGSGGSLFINSGTVGITGGSISDSIAVNGGGIYNKGTLTISKGSEEDSGTITNCVARTSGGGIYTTSKLTLDGAKISDCYAVTSGGGIYHNGNNLYPYGTITKCYAGQGGGVYSNTYIEMKDTTKTAEISDCHAATVTIAEDGSAAAATERQPENLGGGIYKSGGNWNMESAAATVSGCSAYDGGGVYYNSTGTMTYTAGNFYGNTAKNNGGAIYKNGTGSVTMSGGVIGGSSENANKAQLGSGIFVADGQNITLGGGRITHNVAKAGGAVAAGGTNTQLLFQGAPVIRNNTNANGEKCNVYLNYDTNDIIRTHNKNALTAGAYIGVYVTDAQFVRHGDYGLPFGTYNKTDNLSSFYNDRIYAGGKQGSSNNEIVWGKFVCKITDAAGNLLYTDVACEAPAVYMTLENDGKANTSSAFGMLSYASPNLYNADGQYSGAYQVQMLVGDYECTSQMKIANGSRDITLTTASRTPDDCGFYYTGTADEAVIRRGTDYGSMINTDKMSSLVIENITIDGGSENGRKSTAKGGIMYLTAGTQVYLNQNATLCNSNAQGNNGAGIRMEGNNNSKLFINGAVIRNCVCTGYGGAISGKNGDIIMNSGLITECSAAYGAGIVVERRMDMNGGEITGNSATSEGGGINIRPGGSVHFSGNPVISGNTLNGSACNLHLINDNNTSIYADGLGPFAEIRVYTTAGTIRNKHGLRGMPFGTWTNNENLHCFINDVTPTLRGMKTTDNKFVYWRESAFLSVGKVVESDWAADKDEKFDFTVTLTGQGSFNGTYGDMTFENGKATFTLTAGKAYTASGLPFDFIHNGVEYTVTETLRVGQEPVYTTQYSHNGGIAKDGASVTGHFGENMTEDPLTSSTVSSVVFTNTRVKDDLTVSKTVTEGSSGDNVTPFAFTVTLDDNTISKSYDAKRFKDETDTTGTDEKVTFEEGVGTFELTHGQAIKILGLPTELGFKVEEILTDDQYANFRTYVTEYNSQETPVKEGEVPSKEEILSYSTSGKIGMLRQVAFRNNRYGLVCKIVNDTAGREQLYYRDYPEDYDPDTDPLPDPIPAIFDELEKAFETISGGISFFTADGDSADVKLRVEMVKQHYKMKRQAVLAEGYNVTLGTAQKTDRLYPYPSDAEGFAVVTRGYDGGSMIVDNGNLTIDNITLDGGGDTYTANSNGGIVQVNGAQTLTITERAILCNSVTTENGGAIWIDEKAGLVMDGTITGCQAANGGGVYAADGFGGGSTGTVGISIGGTISGCTAAAGNGGALYAGEAEKVLGNAPVILTGSAQLSGNEAVSNGGAIYSATDVTINSANVSVSGNAADKDGGGIYQSADTTFTMSGGTISSNTATTGNGGGLWVNHFAISRGVFSGNKANGEAVTDDDGIQTVENGMGGAIYTETDTEVSITGATFTGNEACQGGAVYDQAASFTVTNVTMTGNIATKNGGAVYAADGCSFTMNGGSIGGHNQSPEGAVSTGESAVLNFSGNASVTGNTGADGTTAMNVFLGYHSNTIIKASDLTGTDPIGVYVKDGEESIIYYNHGIANRPFGTGATESETNLSKFVNDRDPSLTGIQGPNGLIMWPGKDLVIQVYQNKANAEGQKTIPVGGAKFKLTNENGVTVWSGASNPTSGLLTIPWGIAEPVESVSADGGTATFTKQTEGKVSRVTYILSQQEADANTVLPAGAWQLSIGTDNALTWSVIPHTDAEGKPIENENRTLNVQAQTQTSPAYIGDRFVLYEDVKPTITFDPNGGRLSGRENDSTRTDPVPFTSTELNHNYTVEESNPTKDNAVFRVWSTVLKPVAGDGHKEYKQGDEILFYRHSDNDDLTLHALWSEVVCKITDREDKLLYVKGSPAVYMTLKEGFDDFNEADFTYEDGKRATPRKIKMLVESYEMTQPVELARGKIAEFMTAPSTDTDGYKGPEQTCVITRAPSFDQGGMITDNYNLVLRDITLDGTLKDSAGNVKNLEGNGSILTVTGNASRLTLTNGATLRNAAVSGNGGAIFADEHTYVSVSEGSTITGCRAANGGAVYAADSATVYISGGEISNNTAVTATEGVIARGGGVYANGEVDMPGGTVENNNAAAGGGLYLSENARFTITGGSLSSNRAANGGGVYNDGVVTLSETAGVISGNSATANGGGVYVSESGKLELSGGSVGAEGKANTAANGGGVYLAGKATLTGGSIRYNAATENGGGLYIADVPDVKLNGTEIANNRAATGGGVYVNKPASSEAEEFNLALTDGAVENNTASGNGGGVYLTAGVSFEVTGGALDTNTAQNGGGAYVSSGSDMSLTGGTVDGNSAKRDADNTTGNGAGIYVEGSNSSTYATLRVESGTISGNNADTFGAAVYLQGSAQLRVSGGEISGNAAEHTNGGAINAEGTDARIYLSGTPTIFNNPGNAATHAQKNLVLSVDQNNIINTDGDGLDQKESGGSLLRASVNVTGIVGIYAIDDDNVFNEHGVYDKPFGTFGDEDSRRSNAENLVNDRLLSLHGVDKEENIIYWQDAICKVTDENDILLYQLVEVAKSGLYVYAPAVYTRLKNQTDRDGNVTLGGMDAASGTLYRKVGEHYYTVNNIGLIKVKMLKDYTLQADEIVTYDTPRDITLTTAETEISEIMSANEDSFVYIPATEATGERLTKATLTRSQWSDSMFVVNTLGYAFNVSNIVIDGVSNTMLTEAYVDGGAFRMEVNSSVFDGVTLKNLNATRNGGAICLNAGSLTLQNSTITGSRAADNGGAVYAAPGSRLTMTSGTISGNSATRGGAVYVDYVDANNRGSFTLTGGTINGNTAANGAGIYLAEDSRMNLSGNPYFGGTGRDADGNLITTRSVDGVTVPAGNFAGNIDGAKNGGKPYTKTRQDIYLADQGTTDPLRTLVLTDALTDPDNNARPMPAGSIWVWAGGNAVENSENYHYQSKHQFAMFADNVRNKLQSNNTLNSTLLAFRNARDDETAENNTGDYLSGAVDVPDTEHPTYIYWNGTSGSRKVILRKVSANDYTPLSDRSFTVCQGTGTAAYTVKHQDGTTETLTNLTSQSSGVFWIGELPYGTYTIREGNVAVFTLTVGDDTVPGSRDGVVITPVS